MAWQVNHLLYETDGTSSQSHTSSSFTPTANAVLCVFYGGYLTSETDTIAWAITDSEGLTWTQQDRTGAGNTSTSGGQTEGIFWYADVGGSPAAMTITVEMHASTSHEHGFMVFEIEDGDASTPFDQFAISVDQNASADPFTTDTLGSTPSSGLLAAGFLQQRASSGSRWWDAAPTNWTTQSSPTTSTWIDAALLLNTTTNVTSVSHGVAGTAALQNTMMFIAEVAEAAGVEIGGDLATETDTALDSDISASGTASIGGDQAEETDTAFDSEITASGTATMGGELAEETDTAIEGEGIDLLDTTIFNSTAVDEIGAHNDGTAGNLTGRVLWAQVLDDCMGGPVRSFMDARIQAVGDTSFDDVQGNTWNLGGTAAIVAYDSVTAEVYTATTNKGNILEFDEGGVDKPVTGILAIGEGDGEDQVLVYKQATQGIVPLWEDKITYKDQSDPEALEDHADLKLSADCDGAEQISLSIDPRKAPYHTDAIVGYYARVLIQDSYNDIDEISYWIGRKRVTLTKEQDAQLSLEMTQ